MTSCNSIHITDLVHEALCHDSLLVREVGEQVTAIGEGDGSSVHLSLLDRRTLGLGKAVASEVHGHSVDARIRRTFAVDHLKKEDTEFRN